MYMYISKHWPFQGPQPPFSDAAAPPKSESDKRVVAII